MNNITNCEFCNKELIYKELIWRDRVYKIKRCFNHIPLKVSYTAVGNSFIYNEKYRIGKYTDNKWRLQVLKPEFKLIKSFNDNPNITPENFERKLKTMLVFL